MTTENTILPQDVENRVRLGHPAYIAGQALRLTGISFTDLDFL